METLAEMEARYKALGEQIQKAQEEAQKDAKDAAKVIHEERTYEWKVEWRSDFLFRVDRRLSQETMERIAGWQIKYPGMNYPHWGFGGGSENRWEGMSFYMIEGYMLSNGGGTVIFISKRGEKKGDWSSSLDQDPIKLTDEEIKLLKAGMVPDTLLRP